MWFKAIVQFVKELIEEWGADQAQRLAAGLAYYTMVSIAPLLVLAVVIAGQVFDEATAREALQTQLQELVGEDSTDTILLLMGNVNNPSQNIFATLISLGVMLTGASLIFGQLKYALNIIWKAPKKSVHGLAGKIWSSVAPFVMVLGMGLLLISMLLLNAVLGTVKAFLAGAVPEVIAVWQWVHLLLFLGITTLMFAIIFKVLPDVHITWGDVWVGAGVTTLLFHIGRYLIGLYLRYSSASSAYGAAGSLVAILIWVYFSAQILFFGAEFTKVYAHHYGSQILPSARERSVAGAANAAKTADVTER